MRSAISMNGCDESGGVPCDDDWCTAAYSALYRVLCIAHIYSYWLLTKTKKVLVYVKKRISHLLNNTYITNIMVVSATARATKKK